MEGKAREDFDVKVDITVDLHQEQKIAESTKDADQKQPITQTQRQVEIAEKRKSLMKLGIWFTMLESFSYSTELLKYYKLLI